MAAPGFVPAAQPAVAEGPNPAGAPAETIANLSAQIVQRADQKTSRFDMQLTPEGFGRVDVAVEIDAQGKVTAALSFEKPESAALVKTSAGDLQAALAASGLNLAGADLRISHVGLASDAATPSTPAIAQQIVALANTAADSGGAGGHGGQPQGQAQHFAAGGQSFAQGQSFSQGQQGQGQPDRPQTPTIGGARSFEAAASAADGVDRLAVYRAGVNARGLDIRI